jgi:hypothetical protein
VFEPMNISPKSVSVGRVREMGGREGSHGDLWFLILLPERLPNSSSYSSMVGEFFQMLLLEL